MFMRLLSGMGKRCGWAVSQKYTGGSSLQGKAWNEEVYCVCHKGLYSSNTVIWWVNVLNGNRREVWRCHPCPPVVMV